MIVLSRQSKVTLSWSHSESQGEGKAVHIFSEPGRQFYRFDLEIPQGSSTLDVKYTINIDGADPIERTFAIAGKTEAFNILFHSCKCDGPPPLLQIDS